MDTLIPIPAFELGLLADSVDVGNTLTGAKIALYKNAVSPTRDTLLAAYEIADFTGYAAEAITWNAPSIADGGIVEMVGIAGEFRPTDGVTPNLIYGGLLLKADDSLLGAFEFADGPQAMNGVNDSIIITLRVRPVAGGLGVLVS